ncbi:hypothetical protein [uncultured Lacinutrix sp.]|uniref:hypothetical protein n=1 Tax=uncultured Lacinutrix sp. TaxID=574032 RepID=UPI002632C611|nr:hypothetical protein [uncultured Lacinutrix sp.]
MKFFKNRRLTVLFFFIVLMIGLSFNSCQELIKNKGLENKKTEATKEEIKTNQNEAKLLVMLSKDNQDVIQLSKSLQKIAEKDSVLKLAKKIEKTHIEIAKEFNKVATNKLITIPNHSELIIEETTDVDQEAKLNALNELKSKIKNQLYLLNKLDETTKSKEFKLLIVKADTKINESLNKTKHIISNLKSNS